MDQYQEFIAASRYARWREEDGRRETWKESTDRVRNFWLGRTPKRLHKEINEAVDGIYTLDAMGSMRVMMTAGAALERDNVAGYNCAYAHVDHVRLFDELAYILLCGTGMGYSVEKHHVSKLAEVAEEFHAALTTIVVPDSKVGWAKSLRQLISL